MASRTAPAWCSTADEYPGSSPRLFQINDPSALLSAKIAAPRPPGLTRIRSLNTSGDSLRPHRMFEPPNLSRRLIFQNTFPVAASTTDKSPLAPNVYRRSPSTVGVERGPSPMSLLNRRPCAISQAFLPVAASYAITYSVPLRAPRV